MRELLAELRKRTAAGLESVLCRVVETRGSTPQKAGAAMLVFADGSQTGTLGGGCIEAEVKRRALGLLGEGADGSDAAQVFRFNLDSDYGWDDGLICGGRMQILVEPVKGSLAGTYLNEVSELAAAGRGGAEVIVFDAEKAGAPAPASYLFDADGRLLAWSVPPGAERPEGDAPPRVRSMLEPLDDRPRPKAREGMAFLPILPRCRLVIVGAGHVGQAVANLAVDLDFDVCVVDDRAEYASRERFSRVEQIIAGPFETVLPELEITPDTYCLIVTRGHNHDEEALHLLIDRGARYLGLIGSKRKIKLIFEDLAELGVSQASLRRVYAPLGIDIGSQTVMEIAVSILAELVSHRNRHGFVPGRRANVLAEPVDSEPVDSEPGMPA